MIYAGWGKLDVFEAVRVTALSIFIDRLESGDVNPWSHRCAA